MTTRTGGRPRKTTDPARSEVSQYSTLVRGRARRGLLASIAHWAALVLGPVVLLSLIAAIVVYVRLLHGPVSLKTFAADIESGINAELEDLKAHIDDAVLTLSDDRRMELRLINLRFTETDGDLVASAPLAAVELSTGALWRLTVAPERVFLIEPRVSLFYSDQSGLAMSFEAPQAGASPTDPAEGTTAVQKGTQGSDRPSSLPPSFHRVDLARTLAESSRRARRGGDAASNLKEIGVRNATLAFHYAGRTSELIVEQGAVSLEHRRKRSVISGAATVRSETGPWSITFRTEDSDKTDVIQVSGSIRDLVPRALALASPQLSLLETLETPVAADLSLELSTAGNLRYASLALDIGRGRINLPSLARAPLILDHGEMKLSYDAEGRRLTVQPSKFRWGDSGVTLAGEVNGEIAPDGKRQWQFRINGSDGKLAAEEFGIGAIPIDVLSAQGSVTPAQGLAQLSSFTLKAGGAEVTASGEILSGADAPSTRIEASMSPMTLPTLKALWPRATVPGVRTWVGNHVTKGTLKSASLKLLSGSFIKAEPGEETLGKERLSMTIEMSDLEMVPMPQGLPVTAPRALVRLETNALEVTVPDAAVVAGTKQVPLKGGRFTVVDIDNAIPQGELAFKLQTTLPAVMEALSRSRLELAKSIDIPSDGIDGKIEGQFKISMPLIESGEVPVPKAEGKARISDLRGKPKNGRFEIQGGTIDVDLSHSGVLAQGEVLLNGVLAKINVQRIFDAAPELQPPIRVTARLDNADRTQLGLDVNHLVQGETALEITLVPDPAGVLGVHGRVDLTNAELIFEDLAWRKVPGRAAFLEFDVAGTSPEVIELRNFKVVGDNIAIEGWLSIDSENELREFAFPNFSLNVVSRLEVQGKLGSDKILKVKAKGQTFDARDLFRSLLALGRPTDTDLKPLRPVKGIEVTSEIDTVLGHDDVALRNVEVKIAKRMGDLVALDVKGTLDNATPFAAVMTPESGRKLFAESLDAGQVLKLTGFYPNMQGGRMRLEVDLEAKGAAEKSGVLWVDDFRVLGDSIVSEVYSSAESSGPAIESGAQGRRRIVREVFDFSRLKVPFSVGHGQFVLDESYLRGPVMGASIRGKVDFAAERVSLGGTYVPLQGINSAFCDIPLVGPIVSGLDCQGVFGITYAIEGTMSRPQVIVNPLSMFTPGILRGIMEMTNPNPAVLPRNERPKAPVEQRVRASSSAATSGQGSPSAAPPIDGWSSETESAQPAPAGAQKPKAQSGKAKPQQKSKPAAAAKAQPEPAR